MQLFSIGLFQLNMDGTKKFDGKDNPLQTYNQDDIMSMARAWTGFVVHSFGTSQEYRPRSNFEGSGPTSHMIDPLTINRNFRDMFPKSNLFGGYIGDGYPLCTDLPPRDHLRKGASYRLLGKRANAELQYDLNEFNDDDVNREKLILNVSSPLYEALCAAGIDGECTYPGKVVLEESLIFDSNTEAGVENTIDTIRTVQLPGATIPIYYE